MYKNNRPEITTSLPGPVARAVLTKDDQYISPSYTRGYPLVIGRGEGVVVFDVDGNRFLDFTSGIAVCNTGHCHPRVVEAIVDQAGKFLHMSGTDFYYSVQSELAEKLAQLSPGERDRRVFTATQGRSPLKPL